MTKKFIAIVISILICFNFISCNSVSVNNSESQGQENYLDSKMPSYEQVKYPEGISFEDYEQKSEVRKDNPVNPVFLDAVNEFTCTSTVDILINQDDNKNYLYSPISLFMALSLTATGAKDKTRDEILSALNMKSTEVFDMPTQTRHLFNLLYTDNEIGQLKIANSLWLSNKISFNNQFLDTANKNYYASLFPVDFSDEKTSDLISDWIEKNSKGTLDGKITINDSQIMSLINCIYFYDEWKCKFDEKNTQKDSFFLSNGEEIVYDYMNMETQGNYIDGDGYLSASLSFKNNKKMTFYLPDEGINVYDLIATPEKVKTLLDESNDDNSSFGQITYKIPKFSFGNTFQLKDSLIALGIEKAFGNSADFSGITDGTAFISDISQATHISIDEKGCEASAYTQIVYYGSAFSNNHAEIILNRPFIFTITANDVVLFIGVVNG